MKTKEERKERRQKAIEKLKGVFGLPPQFTGEWAFRPPDAEDIQAALALSAAIGMWALSRFDPAMRPAIEEAWEALKEERADTPDDLRGLAEREQ